MQATSSGDLVAGIRYSSHELWCYLTKQKQLYKVDTYNLHQPTLPKDQVKLNTDDSIDSIGQVTIGGVIIDFKGY